MHCKRCGKALGTDRGICPFCGAMLSNEQYEIYRQNKESNLRAELLTEKYGEKKVIYEKREEQNNILLAIVGIIVVLIIISLIILLLILSRY